MKQPTNIKEVFIYIRSCKQVKLMFNNISYLTYIISDKIVDKILKYKTIKIDILKYKKIVFYKIHNYYIISEETYKELEYGKKTKDKNTKK